MRFSTIKHTVSSFCVFLFAAMAMQSCGGDPTSLSNKEVADLQKQLDSTMQMYQEMKKRNAEYDVQMASRDSAITAQAEEIQSLIDQLGGKQPATANNAAKNNVTVDNKKLEQQQKDLREKENTIKELRKQIEQQSQQIKSMQAQAKKGDNSKDASKDYKNQIAQLQKQIDRQNKQISDLKAEAKSMSTVKATPNCDQVKKDYEGKMTELNGQIKSYKSQISDLNQQIKGLKNDVKALKAATPATDTAAANELAAARKALTNLTRQLNECRGLNTQYQNDVKSANDNLASVKAELAKCQNDLTQQVAQVKSLSTQQSEGSKSEQQLRSELAAMTQKEASLRSQNEELLRSQAALTAKCESDKESLSAKIASLQQEVDAMQTRVEQLTADNSKLAATVTAKEQQKNNEADIKAIANLTAQVESQRAEIAKLQAAIEQRDAQLEQQSVQLAAARQEANEAKESNSKTVTKNTVNKKLADLQALCDSYVAEIERLRAENEQLKTENAELKDKMAGSAELFAENERLQQKVKLASVLVTSDLKVTPGKSLKTGNVVKPTTKAAQTKLIRIDCRIIDNNVIDPGPVTIYARIANAANRVVCNGSAENYSFDLDGTTMQYTTKQDIEFTGYGRNLTMLWNKSDNVELTPGLYWVTLYANGYEIGKVSFKLE